MGNGGFTIEEEYKEFYESRPKRVQDFLDKIDPRKLWKVKATGQIVQIVSVQEPEDDKDPITCTVYVPSTLGTVFERWVFGYSVDDLIQPSDHEVREHLYWGNLGESND